MTTRRRMILRACVALCAAPIAPALATEPPPQAGEAAAANRLSLSLVQDFTVSSGAEVCSMRSQLAGSFACFRSSGTQYHGTPLPGRGGVVDATPAPATTRILAGLDRVIAERFTVGLRLGYVVQGGGPRESGAEAPSFLPFHAELRAGYTLGQRPFQASGFRWTLFACGGLAQIDTEHRVLVTEDTSAPPPVSQLDNPPAQTLRAYRKAGTGFLGGGAALAYAISPALGVSAGLRIVRLFPSPGTALAPEISWHLGF